MQISEENKLRLLKAQETEMTECMVYKLLARIDKNPKNKEIFLELSREELNHAKVLKTYTQKNVLINKYKVIKFYLMARFFGIIFTLKFMEAGEKDAGVFYMTFPDYPELCQIAKDEDAHEMALISILNEDKLEYIGSIVLGLNDALVEFTGALAGFTLALNDSSLIALTGSITGISASLSMASSEYLSTKTEDGNKKHPLKASVYTGITYVMTVFLLIMPFVIFKNVLLALAVMLLIALMVIALFNYYYSVVRSENFKSRFLEMACVSFSVAGISFLIGYLLKLFTGIES